MFQKNELRNELSERAHPTFGNKDDMLRRLMEIWPEGKAPISSFTYFRD